MTKKIDLNGNYVKIPGDPSYWAIDAGKKTLVTSPDHMNEIGLRPIVTISAEDLEEIPVKAEKKTTKKTGSEETPE